MFALLKNKLTRLPIANNHHRLFGAVTVCQRAPLLRENWKYVGLDGRMCLEDYSCEDWDILMRQRKDYEVSQRGDQFLEMLMASQHAPTFGYPVNNFDHCLQSATKVLRDMQMKHRIAGFQIDEELVVLTLFHDLFFVVNNENHSEAIAVLLRPFICERNHFLLRFHDKFQWKHAKHCAHLTDGQKEFAQNEYAQHPFFDYTAQWVAKYDQAAMDPNYKNEPIETFVPMVHRFFNKKQSQTNNR